MAHKYFYQQIQRWKHLHVFIKALLESLCKRMIRVLKENTPGEEFPTLWTYDIQQTGSTYAATVFNSRLGAPNRSGSSEDFLQIAIWLNDGTSDHWIEPVKAQVLHWEENGQDYFSMGHMVRGIAPSTFKEKAQRVSDEFQKTIEDKFNEYMATGRLPR